LLLEQILAICDHLTGLKQIWPNRSSLGISVLLVDLYWRRWFLLQQVM